jgi:GT2 family glycosyltransferase
MSTAPPVSIVVLSYNRPRYLREALASIVAQTRPAAEVLVVDNRSPASDEVARVVATFRGIGLLANEANLGFAGGMNTGLRAAAGDYVFLTEDDMVLDPRCLEAFLAYADRHPHLGLATGLILKKGGNIVHYAGGDLRLGGVFRLAIRRAGTALDGRMPDSPSPVSYATGAMMFARTEFLRGLGGFREDFFMYMEDVELCLRIARWKRPIVLLPEARAHHLEPAGQPVDDVIEFHKVKNLVAVYLLHARVPALAEFVLRYGCLGLARQFCRDRRAFSVSARAWRHSLSRTRELWRDRRRAPDHPGPVQEHSPA